MEHNKRETARVINMTPTARFAGIVILIDDLDIELEKDDSKNRKSIKQWKLIKHYFNKNSWKYDIEYVPSNGIHAITIHTTYDHSKITNTINNLLRMNKQELGELIKQEEEQCHTQIRIKQNLPQDQISDAYTGRNRK